MQTSLIIFGSSVYATEYRHLRTSNSELNSAAEYQKSAAEYSNRHRILAYDALVDAEILEIRERGESRRAPEH